RQPRRSQGAKPRHISPRAGTPAPRPAGASMPGRASTPEATVAPGGIYLIDDLSPQPGWPGSRASAVTLLLAELEKRKDFRPVRLDWTSGLLMAVRSGDAGTGHVRA